MRLRDIAWLAGLLQTRGSMYMMTPGRGYRYICLCFVSEDEHLVNRVAKLWKRNVNVMLPNETTWNDELSYRTIIVGKEAHGWLMTLLSFFSGKTRAKGEMLLSASQ